MKFMYHKTRSSLIFTPPRIAQIIVGSLSFLFLIQLSLSAANVRRGGMVFVC